MSYTPTCPDDRRAAFDSAPQIVKARALRAKLAQYAGAGPYDRATDILARLDEVLAGAEAEWPIITGPYPHLSSLNSWLAHWSLAAEAACREGEFLAAHRATNGMGKAA